MRSHKKTLDHVCNICGRGFKEYWYLSTHLRTHDREGFNSVSMEATTNPIYPQPSNQRNENDINPAVQMMIKNHIQRPKIEESHSSWSPLDQHEDVPFQRSKTPEPKPVHVSRRKSSQPSRHTSERYEEELEEEQPAAPPTRSRKSKPRKLSRPSYMAPVFQVLSPELAENGQEITSNQNCEMEFTSEGNVFEEQPLDLSVANSIPRSSTTVSDLCSTEMDEPLNLAIK
uniref:C2H2-type domain-containing protein n=1 Tax=Ciona savignyi TaxID=51511 RepID=H2Z361_CIOSA